MTAAWSTRLLRRVAWRRQVGMWMLLRSTGAYRLDSTRGLLWTTGSGQRPIRLLMSRAGRVRYDPDARFTPGALVVRAGEVMALLREPPAQGRARVVVLPLQLNAAENPINFDPHMYALAEYLDDHTGGPRGQLACDLGLAQFLLDNAAHSLDPGRGIDHLRECAELHLHNGYLVNALAGGRLKPARVSILAALNVPVAGVDPGLTHLPAAAAHTVGLVYASAVPMGAAYGNAGPRAEHVAKALLTAQYAAAIWTAALSRSPVDLFLMPLGGGVFGNNWERIARAAASEAASAALQIRANGMRLHVLAWEGNPREVQFWRRIAAGE